MSTADGSVLGTTQIWGNSPRNHAFNILLLAEGFTAAQQADFADACTAFVNSLWATPPFDGLKAAINIFRVNVTSTDSGADDPAAAGGTGATARTYFDATFGANGIRRLLVCNATTALTVAAAQVPEFTVVLVIVNSTVYGGSGGSVGAYSLAAGATEIAIHEMGHTAFAFADEYAYYAGGNETGHDHHPAGEPSEPNVTTNTNRATLKWRGAVAAATALPTMANPDCATVDSRASTVPAGTVGLFEGAHYYHCGAYRPEYTCKMQTLGVAFCRVCRGVISNRISPLLPAVTIVRNTRWVTAWGLNRLDIFGIGTDGAMYHKAWDGTAWRPSPLDWERLGGVFTSPPAVAAWGQNRLDIFGLGTDGAMYHKAWDGAAWRPSPLNWERLGGVFTSPPAVVSWGQNRLDIFGLGTDGAMYHKAWDGSAWRPSPLDWERLGGVFTSPPAVAAWGHNRLDIFGLGTGGAMYHKAWDGSAWRPSPLDWERLGGVFTSPPAVAAWGQNRLDIFGLGTDGAMYHKAWDGSAWRPSPLDWERLGGVFTSPPSVAAWGLNRLDIFGLGTDGATYHKAWDGSAWRPSPLDWERLGGVFTSPPDVAAWGLNRLDIFGLGTDGAMYHKAWDGTAWRPTPLNWERLGGVFTAP